ncbi:hypothetical protein ACN28C_24085 [Plantactinospora sp. WMMC1484]|uniref:hypothetical protein n=1 Tax=Plantactinospora sp. WMMC1484 TaxID=3404122 RepID=UPI003BF5C5C5
MTAVDLRAARDDGASGRDVAGSAGRKVIGLALRQVRRGAVIVVVLVAGMSAMVAATYAGTVGDALDAAALAALAENPAIRTLFGTPVALDQAGGFTVWRTGTVLGVLLGIWGLLAATRTMRGEEDAGRWDLLAAGRLPVAAIVTRHATVLAAVPLVAGLATAGALTAAGTPPHGALLHGAGLALLGVYFVAAGALAAQLFPTRGAASGAAMALLGTGLLARMLGDGVDALGWLRWLSPFGLVALVQPYAANRLLPLAVLAAVAAGLLGAALVATRHRDLRGGWFVAPAGRPPRLWLLGSLPGFAARRLAGPLLGWAIGIAGYALLIGVVAVSITSFLADNTRFAELAAAAGFGGLGSVEGYVATMYALLAIPIGAFVAVRIGALAADETDRRLALLYAQPVTRHRLLTAELAVTVAGAVLLALAAGLASWAGAARVGAPLGLGAALAGTANVLPVALLSLGAAVLALGWLPRVVTLVGVLPTAGGFLWQVLADSTGAPAWVGRLSPFAHLAPVPDRSPDGGAATLMLAVATALVLLGILGYRRRDLRG